MPFVLWCRKHAALFPKRGTLNVSALLLSTTALSIAWAVISFGVLATVQFPPSAPPFTLKALQGVAFFLGNYLGIMTVLPLALMAKLNQPSLRWDSLRKLASSRLLLETLAITVPILALLTWVSGAATDDLKQAIRVAMFIPVAALVMKHGWRAAAIGGALTITCICLTLAAHQDPYTLSIQAFMAFALTSLLVLGARIAVENQKEDQEKVAAKQAIRLAQQGLYLSEMRMRQTSFALEQIGSEAQVFQHQMLSQLRRLMPAAEGRGYYRQVSTTHQRVHQLANSLYPLAWRDRGLPTALRETLARVLDEAGVAYRVELEGRGLSQLGADVHIAIYRMACEAAVYLCTEQGCSSLKLRLRGGETHGRRWAVLRLDGSTHAGDSGFAKRKAATEWRQVATKLGTHTLGIGAMRDQALIYGGGLHTRTAPHTSQITVLFHDSAGVANELEHTEDSLPQLNVS